ncbi:hypothetical protein [Nitrobacter vulgaris]|uniref:hypothetical protein n=1 Tax=Nitrobacter vulgaris TaxID=29421 RepID=UPI001FCCFFD6|nr:hypothetical protein [Nitrobacter vulgaris]
MAKLVPELERARQVALERLAAEHLRSDKIKLQLHDAAKNGHRALRLPLPDGIDLSKTDGADMLRQWAKQNALTVDWISRTATLEAGRQASGFDVEISW